MQITSGDTGNSKVKVTHDDFVRKVNDINPDDKIVRKKVDGLLSMVVG